MTNDEAAEIDHRLREAYAREPVDASGVGAAIRLSTGRQIRRRLAWRFAIAASVLAALGGYWAMRRTPEPKIFSAAALDHRTEVVQGAPRHWRTSSAEIDTLLIRAGLAGRKTDITGFQLLRAKMCGLDGRRVLHLVYSDGKAEYSLFLFSDAPNVPLGKMREGAERIIGIRHGIRHGLAVGDGSDAECGRFAQAAAARL
jgi:hypothetical protein